MLTTLGLPDDGAVLACSIGGDGCAGAGGGGGAVPSEGFRRPRGSPCPKKNALKSACRLAAAKLFERVGRMLNFGSTGHQRGAYLGTGLPVMDWVKMAATSFRIALYLSDL